MIKIFRKLSLGLSLTVVVLCVLFVNDSIGQTCPTCGTDTNTKTYISASLNVDAGNNNQNNENWSPNGSPTSSQIARFNVSNTYTWIPNNSTTIKGLVLENNANLILDRFGSGNTPSFVIGGTSAADKGCIVVKSGSTLTLKYISNLINVNICVEPGGEIIFDSRDEDRNDFLFNNVEINLQGPDAKISFGEADILVGTGGLTIVGYSGTPNVGCTRNPDGSLALPNPIPNISADPNKTNIDDFCNFLQRAGFSITPVEYLSFTVNHIANTRSNEIKWVTASEKNNSHFVLERSVNDIKSWTAIGEVAGAINSEMPQDYSYTDEKLPLAGGMIYYRLKQVDLEGKYSYGEVIALRVAGINSATTWRVYPNPSAGNDIYLELTNQEKYKGESISLRLLSAHPQVSQQQVTVNDIFTLTEALRGISNSLNKGVAVLEIIWGNQVEYIKLIKK